MTSSTRQWVHGLFAALIGGTAGAIDSGIALMILVPEKFNLGPDLKKTLIVTGVLGILTGIKTTMAYLKQSPLPTELASITETKTLTVEGTPKGQS